MRLSTRAFLLVTLVAAGCASQGGVDKTELARLVGRANDVRIDAQLLGTNLDMGSNIGIVWEVENLRAEPIAIAEIVPEYSYDPETNIVTLILGSEVPGNQLLPKLHRILSGETRTFTTSARLGSPSVRSRSRNRGFVRIRLAYLETTEPFSELVDLEQKALRNPTLADELFLPWVENVRFVTTNEVPLQWNRRANLGEEGRRRPRVP